MIFKHSTLALDLSPADSIQLHFHTDWPQDKKYTSCNMYACMYSGSQMTIHQQALYCKNREFPFILVICWAVWLSHQILHVRSLLSRLVLKTGTDEGSFEAVKAAVAAKWHRRQQGKVKRKIKNYHAASDMHDASIFEFTASIYWAASLHPFAKFRDQPRSKHSKCPSCPQQWIETWVFCVATSSFSWP